MLTAKRLARLTSWVFEAHAKCPRKPSKAFRKCPPGTAYGIHPIFAGALILQDDSLGDELRERVGCALFGHDLLEDTIVPTWKWPAELRRPEVLALIRKMTFANTAEAIREGVNRGPEVLLCELADFTVNLMGDDWMEPAKRKIREGHVKKLKEMVRDIYGDLYIIMFAEGMLRYRTKARTK